MAPPKGKPAAGAGSDEMKFITMKVVGGEPPSNAVLSAKLAPFGCNPKKAGETISKGTQEYTNIRIYVKLSIQSREIKNVEIMPTCSAYIIKALKEPKRQRKKEKGAVFKHVGNLSFDQIKKIAENMRPKSLAREMKGTVKEVLGSCVAVGITVDGKSPKDVQKEIDEGKYKI
jgi:large subunit ribosomal protein L12e